MATNQPTTQLRAAIYARVSTTEQSPELQLRDLRQYAEARGLSVFAGGNPRHPTPVSDEGALSITKLASCSAEIEHRDSEQPNATGASIARTVGPLQSRRALRKGLGGANAQRCKVLRRVGCVARQSLQGPSSASAGPRLLGKEVRRGKSPQTPAIAAYSEAITRCRTACAVAQISEIATRRYGTRVLFTPLLTLAYRQDGIASVICSRLGSSLKRSIRYCPPLSQST